jgi:hypothetical protein
MFPEKPRATLIQRFDGSTLLIGPTKRVHFSLRMTLQEVHSAAEKFGWAITVEHLHGIYHSPN